MIKKIPTNFHVSYVCSFKYRAPLRFLYQQENKEELQQERLRLDNKTSCVHKLVIYKIR